MPQPIPDLSRDQQCHHYQAPSGQRCGSPALKGEYYCYHHHLKHAKRAQQRVLIDPEITRMDLPVIEDRATIFVALAAVIHRLADNSIDTRRAGQMIYALQTALQALPPDPAPAAKGSSAAYAEPTAPAQTAPTVATTTQAPHSSGLTAPVESSQPHPPTESAPPSAPSTPPKQITITKESLLYFLRSRHCANCNVELFPAHELTERANPGAPPEIIEEATTHIFRNPPLPSLYLPQQQSSHRGAV